MEKHWVMAGSAWVCRILMIGMRFLLISLLLGYLGIDQYAIFSIMVSFEAWFFLCDFGLGSSIQNFLSEARLQDSFSSSLMRSIMQLSFFYFFLFLIAIVVIPPFARSFYSSESIKAFQIVGVCYGVTAIGTIAYRALIAFQKGPLSYFLQMIASLLGLASLWMATKNYEGSEKLVVSLLCVIGVPGFFAGGVFYKIFPLRELFSFPNFVELKKISLRASHFFGFGLITAGALSIDYLIMAQVLQAGDIVLYNIFSRLFLALFSIYALFLQAIWPLFNEMLILNRYKEIEALIKRYCLYGVLFITFVTGCLMFFSSTVLKIFSLDQSLTISLSTIGLFGVYYLIRVVCDLCSIVLQSMSDLKIFFILGPVQILISYWGQSVFSAEYGLNGIVMGLICAFLFTTFWALPLFVYRKIRKNQVFGLE